MEPDLIFKILLVGNSGVGKSCLFMRFVENVFSEQINLTFLDFKMKTI